jgi:hypothetical protein
MHASDAPPPTWWGRNWKWVVPVLAAFLLALFAAFVLGVLGLVFGMMKSSEPYRHAVGRAQSDPQVIAALGSPVMAGWFVQGSFTHDGASGTADLSIPLDGPTADGTLYVVAEKRAGEWRYDTLAVNVEGGERIVLERSDAASTSAP